MNALKMSRTWKISTTRLVHVSMATRAMEDDVTDERGGGSCRASRGTGALAVAANWRLPTEDTGGRDCRHSRRGVRYHDRSVRRTVEVARPARSVAVPAAVDKREDTVRLDIEPTGDVRGAAR
jgi:hypothetical protein